MENIDARCRLLAFATVFALAGCNSGSQTITPSSSTSAAFGQFFDQLVNELAQQYVDSADQLLQRPGQCVDSRSPPRRIPSHDCSRRHPLLVRAQGYHTCRQHRGL